MIFVAPIWLLTFLGLFMDLAAHEARKELKRKKKADTKKEKAAKKKEAAKRKLLIQKQKELETKIKQLEAESARLEKSKQVQADLRKQIWSLQVEVDPAADIYDPPKK